MSELKRQQKQPPVISSTGKPVRREHGRVDEPDALVVGDEPDPAAPRVEVLGELEDGGRFAGAEEAADHDVTRFGHGVSSVERT